MENDQKSSFFESDEDMWIKFTPSWFRFLEWIVVIGIFQYLAEVTNHWSIKVIAYLSYTVFGLYIQSVLFCVDHSYIRNKKIKRLSALFFATVITIASLVFLGISVEQIKGLL